MIKGKYIWGTGIMLLVIVFVFMIVSPSGSSFGAISNFEGGMKIHKSSSCGCCGVYGNYFQRMGNSEAEIVIMESLDSLKDGYGVPQELRSCHTTIVGDYFVEGHIPLEAVNKLLEEKPDIAGIAMPGMPEGSPGMPGPKGGDFVIYSVNHDGSYEEWMRL